MKPAIWIALTVTGFGIFTCSILAQSSDSSLVLGKSDLKITVPRENYIEKFTIRTYAFTGIGNFGGYPFPSGIIDTVSTDNRYYGLPFYICIGLQPRYRRIGALLESEFIIPAGNSGNCMINQSLCHFSLNAHIFALPPSSRFNFMPAIGYSWLGEKTTVSHFHGTGPITLWEGKRTINGSTVGLTSRYYFSKKISLQADAWKSFSSPPPIFTKAFIVYHIIGSENIPHFLGFGCSTCLVSGEVEYSMVSLVAGF